MKFICKLKITYSFTGLLFICSFMLMAMFSQENSVSADSVPTLVTKNLTVYAVSGDFYNYAKEAVVTAIDSKGNRVEGVDYYNGPIKYSISTDAYGNWVTDKPGIYSVTYSFVDPYTKASISQEVKVTSVSLPSSSLPISEIENTLNKNAIVDEDSDNNAVYDNYNGNILMAFYAHDISYMTKGFEAREEKNYILTGGYKNYNYSENELKSATSLMEGFSNVLEGKNTDFDKIEAIEDYVDDLMTYDLAGAEQDGTEANNIISGARLNEIVSNDHDQYYGQTFSAFLSGKGDCMQYSMLSELGYIYAGIPAVTEINNGNVPTDGFYLSFGNGGHEWNEVQVNGQWYIADDTWADNDIRWRGLIGMDKLPTQDKIGINTLTNQPLYYHTGNVRKLTLMNKSMINPTLTTQPITTISGSGNYQNIMYNSIVNAVYSDGSLVPQSEIHFCVPTITVDGLSYWATDYTGVHNVNFNFKDPNTGDIITSTVLVTTVSPILLTTTVSAASGSGNYEKVMYNAIVNAKYSNGTQVPLSSIHYLVPTIIVDGQTHWATDYPGNYNIQFNFTDITGQIVKVNATVIIN
ncbi:transglutaminase-like domain-containing protein [Lactococcus lactis]|uniref:transglutaminase-like domain-containing protein n=1 Tax=Lactococcus lactis TaxID=1358 RepID=UPI00223BD539|nr:transglutaminase-like domain-containing protein [Lactococcus lactis]